MSESKRERIDRLLRDGLDHYGTGRVEDAVRCWHSVLALEPGHPEARDYLESAGAEAPPQPQAGAAPPAAGPQPGAGEAEVLLAEAKRALHQGGLETALDLFERVARSDPDRLEAHSYAEMLRSRLLKLYRDQVGDGSALLRMRVSPEEVMRFNLPAKAGFVLSLVDDCTRVDDVLSLSGLDAFETLRILAALVDVGIVEVGR